MAGSALDPRLSQFPRNPEQIRVSYLGTHAAGIVRMLRFSRLFLATFGLLAGLQVGCGSAGDDRGPGGSGGVPLSEEGPTSFPQTKEAFGATVMSRMGALPNDLAQAGKESAARRKHLHEQLIDDEGFGLYYGTEGEWRPNKDAKGLKHPMVGSNCFAWSLEITGDA